MCADVREYQTAHAEATDDYAESQAWFIGKGPPAQLQRHEVAQTDAYSLSEYVYYEESNGLVLRAKRGQDSAPDVNWGCYCHN